MTEPRRHHTVPRFLLAGFSNDHKKTLQTKVLDKTNSRVFSASTKDVMVERDFNSIETQRGTVSLEGFISQIENVSAPIVHRLREAKTAAILSDDERETLATFVALQLIRGTGHRAQNEHLAKSLIERLERDGLDFDREKFAVPPPHILKLEALKTISTDLPEYSRHLKDKTFIIFEAAKGTEFILGDNPITMDNSRQAGLRGNIGMAVPGIEIYLPISKHLTLGLWHNDLLADVSTTVATSRKIKSELLTVSLLGSGTAALAAKRKLEELSERFSQAEMLEKEVRSGGPVTTYSENMDRFNSMQVIYAERYLVSAGGYFDLAKTILKERPETRHQGARGTVQ